MLGVSCSTVQKWVDSGLVPAWRTAGGHRLIPRHAVTRMSEERTTLDRMRRRGIKGLRLDQSLRLLSISNDPEVHHTSISFASSQESSVFMAVDSAFQGLIAFGRFQPNVVIVDMHLSEVDTLEMLKTLGRCKPPGYGHVLLAVADGLSIRANFYPPLGRSVTAVVDRRNLMTFLSKFVPCPSFS
jgi:excisionase family DNA binding protein